MAREAQEMTDKELEDSTNWDLDHSEELEPSGRKARAVVSVGFDGQDFATVSQAARASGMKVSQFIRAAAVERASSPSLFVSFGAVLVETKGLWWSEPNFAKAKDISGASILEPV